MKVIQRFDAPGTLFYVDPPYPTNTGNRRWMNEGYNFELKREDHLNLANLLRGIKGTAVVSSYPNDDYAKLFPGWIRVETTSQTMNKTKAVEELWLSPNLVTKLGWSGEEVAHGV